MYASWLKTRTGLIYLANHDRHASRKEFISSIIIVIDINLFGISLVGEGIP